MVSLFLSFSYISVDEVVKEMDKYTIVDVRSPYEYRIEHIKGAISAPVNIIEAYLIPKNKPIVFYCAYLHHLSEIAAGKAEEYGIKNVFVLNEGFFGWRDEGYPTEGLRKGEKPNTFVSLGFVLRDGKPVKFARVWFIHKRTGQMEVAYTSSDGFYKSDLNFFDIKPADTVPKEFSFLILPQKSGKTWGSRVDIIDGKVKSNPRKFLENLKERGLI
ncbi:rhodanese-like domain-containing protein [Candidatus Caldipriscus sp.]|nr:rhodanese-like domain-containing protein [Candidatus Caldipriscus sp.]